ncbi:gas vesicle protein [Actinomadura rayongensis]|uniref:Gas vesicle protein n=1 Tax=Actinomadura rayongensis TaxID=1429076 RepID=A0A6I4WC54_9ACTN|nr:gas vesicle protein [Actinomadura rayongensis]MXQ66673.1 gas vesicle protein [Actinomadura rayongensis]
MNETERNGDSPGRTLSAVARVRRARDQFVELTGHEPESVSALRRAEDGWEIRFEVLELARVPDTMSLLASYRVTLDDDGELLGYERCHRYTRGQADRS